MRILLGLLSVVAVVFGVVQVLSDDVSVPFEEPVSVSQVSSVLHDVLTPMTLHSEPLGSSREGWKRAIATVFWVGEEATTDNEFIHNSSSAWDVDWEEHFGGVDDPEDRCGYQPCAFKPQENPFYVALPYNDLEHGKRKENAVRIPWNDPSARKSVLKNRWIEVRANETSCFGQWEDVGPFIEDDVEYVFGDAEYPWNEIGQQAGIDLSPALRDCLGVGNVAQVEWRHVEAEEVPDGPWTDIITTRR